MLFWIFIAGFVASVVLYKYRKKLFRKKQFTFSFRNNLESTTYVLSWAFGFVIIVALVVMLVTHIDLTTRVTQYEQTYEILNYQVQNNMYNNDNEYGKKELMNNIRAWNEEIAYYKVLQNDFWIGIFIPNVYDQFEFIDYSGVK